jgi:hypothetical protein
MNNIDTLLTRLREREKRNERERLNKKISDQKKREYYNRFDRNPGDH